MTGRPALALTLASLTTACGAVPQLGGPLLDPASPGAGRVFAHDDAGFCALRAPGRLICWDRMFGDHMHAVDALEDYVDVAVGDHHVCALRRNGEVRCMGDNEAGQLGQDPARLLRVTAPTPVPGLTHVVRVEADGDATCALTAHGTVLCFGLGIPLPTGDSRARSASPVEIPALAGARLLSFDASLACVADASGALTCAGGYGDARAVTKLGPMTDLIELRGSGLLLCGRDAGGGVKCVSQPNVTQGFGNDPWDPKAAPRYPRTDDAIALMVEWGTVCALRRNGDLSCDGVTSSGVARADELADLDGAAAVTLIDGDIGCGLDAEGRLMTQDNAKGFCGEDTLLSDASGTDLALARKTGFSGELSPRLRLGGLSRSDADDGEVHFAGGLEVPFVMGTPKGVLLGPTIDLATASFDTVELGGGVSLVLPLGAFRMGVNALGARAWRGDTPENLVVGTLHLGGAVNISDSGCEGGCGAQYVATGGLELAVRRGLGADPTTEISVALAFDPIVLAAPFALAMADWSFR